VLSHTAEYALRTVLYIAEHGDAGPVRVHQIAAALRIPRNYLSKTLHRLAQAGILTSSRGKGGGFKLAMPAERLHLIGVVGLFDEIGAASDAGRTQQLEGLAVWQGGDPDRAEQIVREAVRSLSASPPPAPAPA